MSKKIITKFEELNQYVEDSSLRCAFAYAISLFLILAALKIKLYLRFQSYTFGNNVLYDMGSVLFWDFFSVLMFLLIFYLFNWLFGRIGSLMVAAIYIGTIAFSIISSITYLRLGTPIKASMLGDIKYEFLRSSIEQQTDIKLLFVKLVLFIIIGIGLPHFLKRVLKYISPGVPVLTLSSFFIISSLFPAYLNANRLGEPDLWKTPLQAFVEPVFDEYRQAPIESEAVKTFSFKSPFSPKAPKSFPVYHFRPENYNVIIYLMEGVPLKLIENIASQGHLPNIENLLQRSASFQHYYTTAADSTKSIISILTSMYPFPGYKKMTNITNKINCESLPKILKEYGYNTTIITSGSFAWDNTRFFLENHFDQTIDQTTHLNKKEYAEFSWGLDDQFLIDQLNDVLSSDKKPHFIFLVATNTHHPYLKPNNKFNLYPKSDSSNDLKNSICYQDHIIGQVHKVLTDHGIADNTITILTSDHSIRFDYNKGEKRGKPQVSPGEEQSALPLILSHPNIKEKLSFDMIGSHLDIAPTLLKMVGLSTINQFQGVNLFQENHLRKINFIISTVRGFDIILRDDEYQFYYDLSNNRVAIRYGNLASNGKEYLPSDFPARNEIYKKICVQFIHFQRQYLKTILP
jgi:arylsulfatase A-like enzyme